MPAYKCDPIASQNFEEGGKIKKKNQRKRSALSSHVLPLCEGAPQNPAVVGLEGTSEVIQTQLLSWAGCSHLARLLRAHPAWPEAPPGVGMGTSELSANK